MVKFAQSVGSKGLGYLRWVDGEIQKPIAKFLSDDILTSLKEIGNVENGGCDVFHC